MDRTLFTRSGGIPPRALATAAATLVLATGLRITAPTKDCATSAPVRPARAR